MFAALLACGTTLALGAGSADAIETIPSNFFSVVDSGGPNDINSQQNDLTRMGRDDTNAGTYQLFWSWDATDFSAQAGNACALFDTNGNGYIDFAVCAEVHNVPAGETKVVEQSTGSPLAVSCNDKKSDRCGMPSSPISFTSSDIKSGDLATLAASPPANLVTETDPFPNLNPDQNWPSDSTIRPRSSNGRPTMSVRVLRSGARRADGPPPRNPTFSNRNSK